jgi:uncharacterized ParB-like nuclease family protein
MSFRTTVVLFAIVLLVVVGLLVYSQIESEPTTDGGLISSFATGVKESDVDTVELARTEPTNEKLVFVRTGKDKWELRQPVSAKVDNFAVDSLVKSLWNAKPTKYQQLTNDPAKHGLAKPTFTVTLKNKGEKSISVNLGDTTIGGADATTFVTTSDRPTVPIALRTADLRAFFREGQTATDGPAAGKAKWLGDFRSKRLVNVESVNPGSDLVALKLTRGTEEISLVRTSNGNWRFENPANFGEADTAGDPNPKTEFFTGVRPLLNLLVNLQASKVDDFIENVPATDLAKYGLAANDPAVIRIELKPKGDAPAEVIYLGKAEEGATPTRIYSRRENDTAVVKVLTDRLPAIIGTLQNPGELRNRDFIAEGNKELIDAIDVTVKGQSFRLRFTGNGPTATWMVYGGPEPRDANKFAVQALIDALSKPRAAKVILPAPAPNVFNPPDIQGEVKVWFDGITKAPPMPGETASVEPKLKGDANASFVIGRVDGDGSFFKRTEGGQTTEYKIGGDLVAALTKSRLDFVKVNLEPFSQFGANALTLIRGMETTEVKKTSAAGVVDQRWSFVQPAANKDASADSETIGKILGTLGTYHPVKIISDSPSADDLKKWGLESASPRIKASVGLTGVEKPREFLLGNEAEDKTSVYLKLADQPFVLLAPKQLFDELAAADFRDKVIFRIDSAKVNRIVLSGWKIPPATAAKQVTLELKAGMWVSNTPGFPGDDAKIKVFLSHLNAPRLTEFVKELNAAEMGLGADNGSLQVFLYQEGVAEPVWIDFGKEEPGKPGSIYATSSGVKGIVFKIDAAYFRQFVLDPKAFQK